MKKKLLTLGLPALALASFFILDAYAQNAKSDQLVLAENQVPLSSLTIIAAKKGYFKNHGLDVIVKQFTSGKFALDAVLGGGADVATVAETPLAVANLSGIPIAVIANIARSDNDIKIAYRKERGIARPHDLRGKIIATAIGTSAEYFLDQFLAKNGLQPSDVKVINLSPSVMVQALSSGDITAFAIFEPYPSVAQSTLGGKVGIFDDPGLYQETFNIAVRPQYAQSNTADLKDFLLALIDAQKFVAASTTEAINIVATNTGIETQTLASIWPQFSFQVRSPNVLLQTVAAEQIWALHKGAVQSSTATPANRILNPSIYDSMPTAQ